MTSKSLSILGLELGKNDALKNEMNQDSGEGALGSRLGWWSWNGRLDMRFERGDVLMSKSSKSEQMKTIKGDISCRQWCS